MQTTTLVTVVADNLRKRAQISGMSDHIWLREAELENLSTTVDKGTCRNLAGLRAELERRFQDNCLLLLQWPSDAAFTNAENYA